MDPISAYPRYFRELYELAEGRIVGLSFSDFAEALVVSRHRWLPPIATDQQIGQFHRTLHLKDLALAQACVRGSELAWNCFGSRYRDKLYSAAMIIAKNDSVARELADSLSGDLFESRSGNGENADCKLASYSGRGSLEGWMKAILAHTYVDRYRSQRRELSLDSCMTALRRACFGEPTQDRGLWYGEPNWTAISKAVDAALTQCDPEQRFLLAAHFFDGWTLAEIAQRLSVHESTVSRRMDRLLVELRRSIVRGLRKAGMSQRQIEESLKTDVRELPFEISGALLRGITLAGE